MRRTRALKEACRTLIETVRVIQDPDTSHSDFVMAGIDELDLLNEIAHLLDIPPIPDPYEDEDYEFDPYAK